MGQADYWENRMPGIGGPRPAPEIEIQAIIHPFTSQDVTVNFASWNFWFVSVKDPSGNVVYHSPLNRVAVPAGGVNKTIPVAGETTTFKFTMPGAPEGTYTVEAQYNQPNVPVARTTFTYSYVY